MYFRELLALGSVCNKGELDDCVAPSGLLAWDGCVEQTNQLADFLRFYTSLQQGFCWGKWLSLATGL